MSDADREHHARYCYLCEDMQIRLSVSEDAEREADRLRTAMARALDDLGRRDELGAIDGLSAALAAQGAMSGPGKD